jgi:fructose/tagatose bisphosphate aldolase
MIDGSTLSFDQNISITKKAVKLPTRLTSQLKLSLEEYWGKKAILM